MQNDVVEVTIRAVFPTSNGCAVFLGGEDKIFVIYIDPAIGAAIHAAIQGQSAERPQTHELLGSILEGFGAKVMRVVIADFEEGVFFARLIIEASNELHQRKVLDIDARPSDSLALAAAAGAPIFVARHVFDSTDDMSEVLDRIVESGNAGEHPGGLV